ncbi:unnamed protein product [Mytilus coruscus]|uniref:CARD domain-containing protein n=1 Tax=Mytilus coruscus TaxID=42192 RepID=A0A6J8A2X9_MYTCO|nr:unnamed protein product [Mytilus coruscus]
MATKEEDNFLRVVYLNYRVGTNALRRYFDSVHPNLPADLSPPPNKAILSSLHKPPRGQRRILYQEQWDILYPPTGAPVVSSAKLDVTLMVCLLRNLPPMVPPPTPNGFDALPQSSDLSYGAHIARIKYYKNFIVSHSKDGKLSDTDFNTIWINMDMAINGLGNQQDITDAADAKTKVLDFKAIMEHLNLRMGIKRNRKRSVEHSGKIVEHASKIAKLETIVENLDIGKVEESSADNASKIAILETTVKYIEQEVKSVKIDVDVSGPKGDFMEFKDKLIHSTILDIEVLDNLISKCVLTLDDREEIINSNNQSSRNKKLLKILNHRPYNTLGGLVEAMKESDQKSHTLLLSKMEAKVEDNVMTLQNAPLIDGLSDTETQIVKLIKWYNTIVHEIDIEKTGILYKLHDVLSEEDNTEMTPMDGSPEDRNRNRGNRCHTIRPQVTQYWKTMAGKKYKKKKERKRRKENGMTDLMIDKVEKWKKDDSLYIETRATNYVLNCVNKHSCVSVIGPSGCGKTALVRHVSLQLEQNGYTIITVIDAKDITDKYKSGRKTLYIVDDICGNFTANQTRLEEWKKSMNDLRSILEFGNCKLILTCRLQVFQDKGFENLDIFKTCECNLISKDLALTIIEKETMTAQYFGEHASQGLKHLGEYDFLPLLCKFYYVEKRNPQFKLDMFFNDPFSFYKYDLTQMYNDCKEGKYKYCALLLLVIFNNGLKEKNITGKDPKVLEIIEDLIEVCDIEENITGRKLKNQIDNLIGTFVTFFFFGTQNQIINILIKHAEDRFIRERFVVKDDNESTHYSIPISDFKLQLMYMKRVFGDIIGSSKVNTNIVENENFKNVKFRTMILDYMKNLSKHEITILMKKANTNFLNTMFVLRQNDIQDRVKDISHEYKCFGIILHDDMIQQYIEKWFDALTITISTEAFLGENRLVKCSKFQTALNSYIRQLNVASIIQTGSTDFLNTMFVITENGSQDMAQKQNERFGIDIPEDLLQDYIARWFDDLTKHVGRMIVRSNHGMRYLHSGKHKTLMLDEFMNKNRPLTNPAFRIALRTYMRQLTTVKIASLIHTAEDAFLNTMFVMTEDDINDKAESRYEWFGIVIPDEILQQYIEKYFHRLTNEYSVVTDIHKNRALKNIKVRTALRTHMKQLTREEIALLIQNSVHIFFNTMFVMTENDIKNSAQSQFACFGIVIPDDLLQQYIQRWFDELTKTHTVEAAISQNRPLFSDKFLSSVRTHLRQLTIENIALIIQTTKADFIDKLFVMTEADNRDNAENRYECFGIVIPDDLLQPYIEKWFNYLIKTSFVVSAISQNRPLINVKFRRAVRTHMKQLTTKNIASIIQTTSEDFINTMFVMSDEDINDNAENRHECFGIIIPNDLLQQYIQRWFNDLKKTQCVATAIEKNRPMMNVTFRSAVCSYMTQLTTENIASIIENTNEDFINKMFVMTEDNIKDDAENKYQCCGIVIPDDLVHQYIERWFYDLTKSQFVEATIGKNRPLSNVKFRNAVRTYMSQLTNENIASIIQNAHEDFLNLMFVMTEDDIKDNDDNRYDCFGIVIPDDMIQQYIQRWFNNLTNTDSVEDMIDRNRPLLNVTFRCALRDHIRQLTTENIAFIIQNTHEDFLDLMFVMTEDDIKDNADNRYECIGIVVPEDLLHQYVQRWFEATKETSVLKKTIEDERSVTYYTTSSGLEILVNRSRPWKNVKFRSALRTYLRQVSTETVTFLIERRDDYFVNIMFVMTEDEIKDNSKNRWEHVGIVIPDDLLQIYIGNWFERLIQTNEFNRFIDQNRPLKNFTFRTALCKFMKQLNEEKIAFIIRNAKDNFINKMFVMTEEEIKENSAARYYCFGIVIPDNLLQEYIKRWVNALLRTNVLEKFIYQNRPLKNETFRKALGTFLRQLNAKNIVSIIRNAKDNFVNQMFVMAEEDIRDSEKNQYQSLGIVIPDDMLQQYIERWFDDLTKSKCVEATLNKNRSLTYVNFRKSVRTHMRQITEDNIASIIQTTTADFVNTMFVLTDEDIKENTENRYECYGIIIPDNLLQDYIQRWFDDLTKAHSVVDVIDKNRPLVNDTFRSAIRAHMRQLNTENIASIIQTTNENFLNLMFVMAEDDIQKNAKHGHVCFGIVIPDELFQQYTEKWLNDLAKTKSVKEFMDNCRPLNNGLFRTNLRTYMKQLNRKEIISLIQTGSSDFLNTLFVMTEDDIKENTENQIDCFGIVVPDDILQQYIERWLLHLSERPQTNRLIDENRLLINVTFFTGLQTFIRHLNTGQITFFIQTGSNDFLNRMFVMTEDDIKGNSKNRYECFGIVIPDDVFLLQQYIKRWFHSVTEADSVKEHMEVNRPLLNGSFRTALCTHIRQLDTDEIRSLIQTGTSDFLNTMFVLTENDIVNDNGEYRFECFGIVIPDDLLQQYIDRWLDCMTKTDSVREFVGVNRSYMNVILQTECEVYMNKMNSDN